MPRLRCYHLATIALALFVLPRTTCAQLDPADPPPAPLQALVPDEVNLPRPLFDTIDRLTVEMGLALREGDTRVVWLVDRSASLTSRREQIARMIPAMIRAAGHIGSNDLETAVVGYGDGWDVFLHRQETRSDIALERLANTLREIPADNTGTENVFSALIRTADTFAGTDGNPLGKEVLFFVITDEPGNDAHRLEEAIIKLNEGGVRCSIAGHMTPFLSLWHFVPFTYDGGFEEPILVDADSETGFRHRIFDFPLSPVDRHEIPSGFGPWTLSRLCDETGGSYLADWSEYKVRFHAADLDEYVPDTGRELTEFEADIRTSAAMHSLFEAARLAGAQSGRFPQIEFSPDKNDPIEELLADALKPAAVAEYHLQRIYRQLLSFDDNPNAFPDPRWRADYELSFARVRAAQVRLMSYDIQLLSMQNDPQPLDDGNDTWRLVPAPVARNLWLLFASQLAEAHLQYVVDENPDTPWAAVAESELANPLGWKWIQETAD